MARVSSARTFGKRTATWFSNQSGAASPLAAESRTAKRARMARTKSDSSYILRLRTGPVPASFQASNSKIARERKLYSEAVLSEAVLWCRFLKRKGLYLLGIASLGSGSQDC
jgi:hypothetical protein